MNIELSGIVFLIILAVILLTPLGLGIAFIVKKKKTAAIISFSVLGLIIALLVLAFFSFAQVDASY
jgi:hypothetical protein